ncbi:MAG TPA: NAD(P)-dependent oxidoreductase, partial [Stellaceae bacterium]|nr:NAD(P)-dependent oxidoreductase [Stellaceae bacterium]
RLEALAVPVLRVTRREVDLLAPDAAERLGALLRPGDVLVAAAAIAPCRTPEMLRDNATLALTLLRAAEAQALAQVVNISSDAVYADAPVPLTEASPAAPGTLHGAMHLAREIMFRAAAKAPLATLRPSLLYGAADPHDGYGPNRFRRLANRREPIVLFGEGEERRDHVLIDDLAELAARVVLRRSEGVLNVATGDVASFRDIARMVRDLAGSDAPLRTTPRAGPMPHNGYRPFDIAQCRAAFPDFAYTRLADGLAKAQRDAGAAAR